MGEFAETGALDPTPDVIDPDSFFEGAWETTVVDGTSYGVPWYVETRLLYYRTDLADQAGLEPPGTWDEPQGIRPRAAGGRCQRRHQPPARWDGVLADLHAVRLAERGGAERRRELDP
jgi:hypothetical protein